MMGMLHIFPGLPYMFLAGFLINGMSGCQVEMFYLKTKLNQSSADTRCIEYTGVTADVWIGLTYNMTTGSWWWPSGEEWTNNPDVWKKNEPNNMVVEECTRLYYTFPDTPNVVWANRECFFAFYALCQRTKDLSSNYMELLYSDTATPVGSTAFRVRGLMDCVMSCVLDCSCQAVHYSGDECRLMTYYLLDLISTTPTDMMGVVYAKTLKEPSV